MPFHIPQQLQTEPCRSTEPSQIWYYDERWHTISNPSPPESYYPLLNEGTWLLINPGDYTATSRPTVTQYIQLVWGNSEGCMRLDTSEGRGLILGGCEQENKPNTVNLYTITNENGSLRIGGAWTSGESCLRPYRDIIGPSSCLEMSSVCDLNNGAIDRKSVV